MRPGRRRRKRTDGLTAARAAPDGRLAGGRRRDLAGRVHGGPILDLKARIGMRGADRTIKFAPTIGYSKGFRK
jgi:hypothetical protein